MPRLSNDERNFCLGLIQGGLSIREAARRMHCHPSTISRLVRRFRQTGNVRDGQRNGRPRVTTPAEDGLIVLSHLRDRFLPATETARNFQGLGGNISVYTVRRRLSQRGLRARRPYLGLPLTNLRRHRRLLWARQHQRITRQQWDRVLFSDESRFSLSQADGRLRVWRRQGERFSNVCVQEHDRFRQRRSVHVWAGISFNHRTVLHVLRNHVTAQTYVDEVLRPIVIPTLQAHQELLVFQHDNARPHAARLTVQFLQMNNVNVMDWPAFSPDMSPIEHLWDELERRVRVQGPYHNLQQLEASLIQEWNRIPQNVIQTLVRSMGRRIRACIQANGGHTSY